MPKRFAWPITSRDRIVDMHRGELLWHHGIVVAFGTDDYAVDEKSREVVQLLTQIVDIPDWKTDKLAFATNDGEGAGSTWVLLLDPRFPTTWQGSSIPSITRSGRRGVSPMVGHRKVATTRTGDSYKRRRSASSSRPKSRLENSFPIMERDASSNAPVQVA